MATVILCGFLLGKHGERKRDRQIWHIRQTDSLETRGCGVRGLIWCHIRLGLWILWPSGRTRKANTAVQLSANSPLLLVSDLILACLHNSFIYPTPSLLPVLPSWAFSLHWLLIIQPLLRAQSIEKPSEAIINYSWINNTWLAKSTGWQSAHWVVNQILTLISGFILSCC